MGQKFYELIQDEIGNPGWVPWHHLSPKEQAEYERIA